MITLTPGSNSHFFYGERLIDVNQIIYDYQTRCDGSDNHQAAQEVSKLRLTAYALTRGQDVEPDVVANALERLGRGWMIE